MLTRITSIFGKGCVAFEYLNSISLSKDCSFKSFSVICMLLTPLCIHKSKTTLIARMIGQMIDRLKKRKEKITGMGGNNGSRIKCMFPRVQSSFELYQQ